MLDLMPLKKILLVEPPFYRIMGYERWYYPVTLTIIGSYLEELGHEVRILDCDQPDKNCTSLTREQVRVNYAKYLTAVSTESHPAWEEALNYIEEFKPDAVGLTSISAQIDSANIIAKKIKQAFGKKITVLLGGAHVDGMLSISSDFNFGKDYDRIIPRDKHLITKIFDRKPNKNLIVNVRGYKEAHFSSILTSLGCPNHCAFCHHSLDRFFALRNIKNLREELEEIKQYFPSAVSLNLIDESLVSKPEYFRQVGKLFKEFGFKFTAGARITDLSKELIADFKEYGGEKMHIGIESGSQNTLDRIEKQLQIKDIIERTKWLNQAKVPWQAFFIAGFPFESVEDLRLTEELAFRIEPTFISLNRFTPYPGTKIYNQLFARSDIEFRDLFQLNKKSCVRLSSEMDDYIDSLFQRFDQYNLKHKNN
ncbi:MAG: cobalamin-dependent protein [Candidatus Omnitrophica bacterium]|nr:cobalamin-dependent protein [Candidatus Omnitrophota bacterium]